jgi:plasmid maintenance system antidote protein VapI
MLSGPSPDLTSSVFGTSERFWINLQARYDLEVEKGKAWRGTRRHPAPSAAG